MVAQVKEEQLLRVQVETPRDVVDHFALVRFGGSDDLPTVVFLEVVLERFGGGGLGCESEVGVGSGGGVVF